MPGSIKTEAETVLPTSMIAQCKSVMSAGGTVYFGENHEEPDARQICLAVLKSHCVQYLCLEVDYLGSAEPMPKGSDLEEHVGYTEGATLFNNPRRKKNPIPLTELVKEANKDSGCSIEFFDKSQEGDYNAVRATAPNTRQNFIRDRIKHIRTGVNKIGRGVIVLVGSDHLITQPDKKTPWLALHEIVYDGHSFVYGKYNTCYMVWQLS